MSDMKKTGFLLKRINSFIIFTFLSITNVVRRCALQLLMSKQKTLDKQTLKEAFIIGKTKCERYKKRNVKIRV